MRSMTGGGALASQSAGHSDGRICLPKLPPGQTVSETEPRLGDTPATIWLDLNAVEKEDPAPTPGETNAVAGAGPSRQRPPSQASVWTFLRASR